MLGNSKKSKPLYVSQNDAVMKHLRLLLVLLLLMLLLLLLEGQTATEPDCCCCWETPLRLIVSRNNSADAELIN